jgi:hygromycin-B 4-O-kinase
VSPAPDVTVDQAAEALRRHHGHDIGPVGCIGEGSWSRAFGYVTDGRALVARFGAHVEDFEKDRRAAAIAGSVLPVPEVLQIGPALGGHLAITTRGWGQPLEQLDGDDWRTALPSVLGVLDALRTIEVGEVEGRGHWDAAGRGSDPTWRAHLRAVADDQRHPRASGWRARLALEADADRTFSAGLALLDRLADACPDQPHLVHGDLLNANVLVRDGRVDTVLDWGCAMWGDWLYDLATLTFWSAWHAGLGEVDVRIAAIDHLGATGVAVPDLDARLLACELHIGLAAMGYSTLLVPEALPRIERQVAARLDVGA